jgi:hypothetical protein
MRPHPPPARCRSIGTNLPTESVIPWRIPLVLGSARVELAQRCRYAVGSTAWSRPPSVRARTSGTARRAPGPSLASNRTCRRRQSDAWPTGAARDDQGSDGDRLLTSGGSRRLTGRRLFSESLQGLLPRRRPCPSGRVPSRGAKDVHLRSQLLHRGKMRSGSDEAPQRPTVVPHRQRPESTRRSFAHNANPTSPVGPAWSCSVTLPAMRRNRTVVKTDFTWKNVARNTYSWSLSTSDNGVHGSGFIVRPPIPP